MRFPLTHDSLKLFLDSGVYAAARVAADPEAEDLAVLIAEPQAGLVRAVAVRNAATNGVIMAEARRDFTLARMNKQIMAYGRDVLAHYDQREHPGYVRMFPQSPSELVRVPAKERPLAYLALVEAARSEETPEPLRPMATELETAWGRLRESEKSLEDAKRTLSRAEQAEHEARLAWITAYRKLFGLLTSRFPDDRRRVEDYFRFTPSRASKKKSPVPA